MVGRCKWSGCSASGTSGRSRRGRRWRSSWRGTRKTRGTPSTSRESNEHDSFAIDRHRPAVRLQRVAAAPQERDAARSRSHDGPYERHVGAAGARAPPPRPPRRRGPGAPGGPDPGPGARLGRSAPPPPAGGAANAVAKLFGDTGKKKAGPDTSLVNAPGALSSLLFQGQLAGEFLVQEENFAKVDSIIHMPQFDRVKPRGLDLFWGAQVESRGARPYRALYAVQNKAIITGEELTKATARRDQLTNQSVVEFTLTRRGGRKFGEETGRHVGDYMAIILDGRVQGQPPVIRGQIQSSGQIELGSKPLTDAQDLALVLRAGALPAPLTVVEERAIGPSLGRDSIVDAIKAGAVGVALVVLIMIGYYRLSGTLAVAALTLYVLFTLAGLAAFGFTLTLPGLAGFVLSVGIAVDANVLIFERIREELRHGKLVRTAVDEGFKHAMNAIVDSNVSTALTAFILYLVGTGPVQGFAITLIIGIAASMVTAVFVVRTFYMIWLQQRPAMTTLSV